MHPSVRNQYKLFMLAGSMHPTFSTAKVREKVKAAFLANKDLEVGSKDFKRALAHGRWQLKELEALLDFHKYRDLRKKYSWSSMHGDE
jgi:hypothetical protein